MKTCEHQRHPVISFLIYLVTSLALFLHILSHMLPIVLLLHSHWIVRLIEHPITTCVALLFIPLSVYHMYRDRQMHRTIHRLTKELYYIRTEASSISNPGKPSTNNNHPD